MADTTDALTFLAAKRRTKPPGVCAVFGDEPFLKRLVITELRHRVLGDSEDVDTSLSRVAGGTADLRDVLGDLDTISLFGGAGRMVVVESADKFVSAHRGALEKYASRERFHGTLVLEVDSWPKNTRLFKTLAETGLQIDCKSPTEQRLAKWLVTWAADRYDARLQTAAAQELLDRVGREPGLLDAELAKLAGSVPRSEAITVKLVSELVGSWRTKTTWDMLNAAVDGDTAEALRQLDRLLGAGEQPIAIVAAAATVLRRFAAATRLIEQAESAGRRIALRDALSQAGVQTYFLADSEKQLRQLGRGRAGQCYRWLLEADLDLKGNSRFPPRTIIERLLVRMSSRLRA